MQYMLLIYDDEQVWERLDEDERNALMSEYFAYTEQLRRSGAYVAGEALHPVGTAKSVRVRDGEQLVTDGPFAETKEALGGFYLIEVDSDEEALAWAAKIPSSRLGTIEVRRTVVFDREEATAS
ncbi:MAG: YciI family protein [Thermoleophilia bacterium]|nr:YciI family protein [Thermoleophilia bacterium]